MSVNGSKNQESTAPAVQLDNLIIHDGSDYASNAEANPTDSAGQVPVASKPLMDNNIRRQYGEARA